MKLKFIFFILALLASFPQPSFAATSDSKEINEINEAADHLDLKKSDAAQNKQLQTTFTLLEKLARTYSGKNPYSLPRDEMKPLVALIVKTLKIDPSQYAVEAAYPVIKNNQTAFDHAAADLTDKERKLLTGAVHDYLDVIKNGN